jgi:hypothetical protein
MHTPRFSIRRRVGVELVRLHEYRPRAVGRGPCRAVSWVLSLSPLLYDELLLYVREVRSQ